MLRIELIGNLTKNPEARMVRAGANNSQVVNFTVAASHGFGDYKRTEFVRVTAWRNLGETCLRYLSKGSKVFITGTPACNAYINRDGQAVGNIELELDEIEFLSPAKSSAVPAEEIDPENSGDDPITDEDIEDLL